MARKSSKKQKKEMKLAEPLSFGMHKQRAFLLLQQKTSLPFKAMVQVADLIAQFKLDSGDKPMKLTFSS